MLFGLRIHCKYSISTVRVTYAIDFERARARVRVCVCVCVYVHNRNYISELSDADRRRVFLVKEKT